MDYYSDIKMNDIFAICDNMDGPAGIIILSEVSLTEKDNYCTIPLTCGI